MIMNDKAIPLDNGTICLTAPEPSDLDTLYIWENDPALWPFGSVSAPVSRHQLAEYIDSYDGDIYSARQLRLVIRDKASRTAVGTLDLTHFNPRDRHARIGIFIAPGHRRLGYAKAAIGLAAEYAGKELGIHMLMALVAADNAPSRALFSAAGFDTCGRVRSCLRVNHSFNDIIIYQKIL